MSQALRRADEGEQQHKAVVNFYSSNTATLNLINATTAGFAVGLPLPLAGAGCGVALANFATGTAAGSAIQHEYASVLAEQIFALTQKPPVAVFDSPEELMDWLDNASR